MSKIMWEKISATEFYGHKFYERAERLKVPNGWIVKTTFCGQAGWGVNSPVSTCVHHIFIKDKEHTWKLEK